MEHRPWRKDQKFNSDTHASDQTYVKEIEELKEKRRSNFLWENKKKANMKKEMKIHESGSPTNGPFLTPPCPPKPKNFSTKENLHFYNKNIFIFPVLASARTTEKRKQGKVKQKRRQTFENIFKKTSKNTSEK